MLLPPITLSRFSLHCFCSVQRAFHTYHAKTILIDIYVCVQEVWSFKSSTALPLNHQVEVGLKVYTEAWRLCELTAVITVWHQCLTLTRSRGCVQHAAPQDASPPKYHRDTRFSAMIPRGAVKPRSCSSGRHVSSSRWGSWPARSSRATALIFKHFDKATRYTLAGHTRGLDTSRACTWERTSVCISQDAQSEVAQDRGSQLPASRKDPPSRLLSICQC